MRVVVKGSNPLWYFRLETEWQRHTDLEKQTLKCCCKTKMQMNGFIHYCCSELSSKFTGMDGMMVEIACL